MFYTLQAFNASVLKSLCVRAFLTAFAFVICISAAQSISAATFTVNTTGDTQDANTADGACLDTSSQCSLRAAITQANALAGDDIINVPAGTYTATLPTLSENLNAGGDFDITTNITINGSGAGNTFIQAAASAGTASERVMHFVTAGTSSLNNVTIRYGRYATNTFGGGVRVDTGATSTFNGVTVRDNTSAGRGGGVYVNGGTLTMNNSTITANTSGVLTTATSIGGAGFYINGGTATLNNTTISSNQSINAATAAVSSFGGGVTAVSGTLNLNNSTINNNAATTSSANNAFGGGIAISGATTVNLTNTSVTNNTASTTGTGGANVGGINNEGGPLTLNASTVSGNSSGFTGGIRTLAGAAAATTNIIQSAIVNNTTTGSAGGIFNIATGVGAATTNIDNSTIGGNTANVDGGGVMNYATASGNAITNFTFSTVAGNIADADGNTSGNGGGLANFGNITAGQTGLGTINLRSSVVGDNNNVGGTSEDIVNTITSQGYNHVENTTLGTFVVTTGDVTGTDPGLMALGLYGGETLNYLPTSTSVLLETIPSGTNLCGTAPFNFDQKNVIRPFDTDFNGTPACEKGASERGLAIITLRNLPNAQRDVFYSTTLVSDYGVSPYTYTLVSGAPPTGLTVNSNGTINGVPTVSGLFTFTVQVQDSNPFAPFAKTSRSLSAPAAPNVFQKTFQILVLPPTAASLSIGGRITTPSGAGLQNARIYLTDAQGNTKQAISSSFGYYRFEDIGAGQTVVITVQSKRYQFEPRVVSVTEDVGNLDFTAAP